LGLLALGVSIFKMSTYKNLCRKVKDSNVNDVITR